MRTVNLYDAKTHLSALVDEAAAGEEIIIAKNGVPKARMTAIVAEKPARRVPSNAMGITYIAEDFDAPDPEIIRMFEGSE